MAAVTRMPDAADAAHRGYDSDEDVDSDDSGESGSAVENSGIAISHDNAFLVVTHGNVHKLSVFSLPGGEYIRSFGGVGSDECEFQFPSQMCFTLLGTLLVADSFNKRVQEVRVEGSHVRTIGHGVIDDTVFSVATNDEVVAVSHDFGDTEKRISMFDAATGTFLTRFGGQAALRAGRFLTCYSSVRFTPSNNAIILADGYAIARGLFRLSLSGDVLASMFGPSDREPDACDILFSQADEVIVCDKANCAVDVVAGGSFAVLRTYPWQDLSGRKGTHCSQWHPVGAAASDGQIYVVTDCSSAVFVFGV